MSCTAGRQKPPSSATNRNPTVVAIDPAATSGEEADETGIVVAGKDKNGHGYVLADISGRYPPTEWARLAITAYRTHRADRIEASRLRSAPEMTRVDRTV